MIVKNEFGYAIMIKMMIILAYDGLEPKLVRRFNCQNIKQKYWGKTNLSEFRLLRTIFLWASFLAGKNMDKKFKSEEEQWKFKVLPQKTFLKFFKSSQIIDLPAFNYDQEKHQKERELLKGYFDNKVTIGEYDECFWTNHQKIKKEFFRELEKNWDLLIAYFNLADAISHLSFGITRKMKRVYQELDEMAKKTKKIKPDARILIISDHGMKRVGRYGDHASEGFFSFSQKINLFRPRVTDFYNSLKELGRG